jgi:hypothetical protein
VDAEATVRLLPGEQGANDWALKYLIPLFIGCFIEDVSLRDEANGRLVRCE